MTSALAANNHGGVCAIELARRLRVVQEVRQRQQFIETVRKLRVVTVILLIYLVLSGTRLFQTS